MTRAVRTLIIDDESLARRRVRMFLEGRPEIEIVGECNNGAEAVRNIIETRPDLVFLDIQMPGMSGFEVISTIGLKRMPAVIFVTAYDQYAIRAFDVHAVDYLLKPFDRGRFEDALARAMRELELRDRTCQKRSLGKLMSDVQAEQRIPARILAKSGGRISILRVDQIDWVEAAGNYVKLYVGKETHLVRRSMAGFQSRLDSGRFARVHRSTIVNLDCVKELHPHFHGDFILILRTGAKVTLSRRYAQAVLPLLGKSL